MSEKRVEKGTLLLGEAEGRPCSLRRGCRRRRGCGCRHGCSCRRRRRNRGLHRNVTRNVPLALLVHQERLARDRRRAANATQLGEVDLEPASLGLLLALALGPTFLRNHLLEVARKHLLLEGMAKVPVDAHLAIDGPQETRQFAASLGGGIRLPLRPATKAEAYRLAGANANGTLGAFPAVLKRNARQGRERPRCAVAHQAVDPPRLPATIAVHRHASRHGGGNGSEGLTVRANEGRARDVHGRDVPHGHQDLIVCWGGNLLCLLVLEKPAGGELGSLHCAQRLDACAKCTVCLRDRLLNVKTHADGVVALPASEVHRHAGANAVRVLLGAALLERT